MEFEIGYMLALIIVGLSFLGFFLAMMVDEVNRKKSIIIFIFSLILFGFGIYYYYVVGQWQKMKGGSTVNKLNYYLGVYKPKPSNSLPYQQPYAPLSNE